MKLAVALVSAILSVATISFAVAQSPRNQRPIPVKPATPKPEPTLPEALPPDQELDRLKIDTDLVTVPVIASSRTGNYIADLKKEEFKITEDGVAQEIAFFATVNAPFHVVLLIDTSDSTEGKLGQIQQAAKTFLDQLSESDRVKIISFDSEIKDWNEFTNDKAVLRNAISQTRSGKGTKVYDAMQLALNMLRPVKQRKAIVMFTDGMDYHSDSATFEGTVHDLDESGVIVYPIRFDTRADTERLARQQDADINGSELPTSGIIRRSGTTPTTFPGESTYPVPESSREPLPIIPPPSVIFGGGNRNPRDARTGRPVPNDPTRRPTDPRSLPPPSTTEAPEKHDTINGMLDALFLMADSYLKQLAERSGGQIYRADTVALLPQAFAAIAAELRTQYTIGYYPINRQRDGVYRKIQVKTTRKDIAIRARPGYRAPNGG